MRPYALKNVVVPYDFSESSNSAIQTALRIVDSHDKIYVVHVTPIPSATDPGVVWGDFTEDTISANLEKSFRNSSDESGWPNLNFTALFGDPGKNICDYASELNAGLIVISSHGRAGLSRILLGSVAERVVRLAPCPVLVLRAESEMAK